MKKLFTLLVFLVILVAIGGAGYMFFKDMDGPVIVMEPDTGKIAPAKDITLHLADMDSGVRSVSVSIRKDANSLVVHEQFFASSPKEATVTFSLKNSGVRDGQIEMEIKAVDASMAGFGRGNTTVRTLDLTVDNVPPRITVLSPPGAAGRKGSACAVSYTLSEEVSLTGIQVGDEFFTAYRQDSDTYFCIFAFPISLDTNRFTPEILATDMAGNVGRSRLLLPARDRQFKHDTLTIGDNFLDTKMPAFAEAVPEAQTNLERYVAVNNVVRVANEQTLRDIAKKTAPTMLWQGAFARLPRAASRANFGDNRTYKYNGEVIDHQTHMGIDLASVKHAPIPAGNAGIVVFADELGIFGKLVIIDHGLGLMSLYSHMSNIDVPVGAQVNKGDTLGQTGVTGLAGGDHLHFGMLVNGIQIEPTDWFGAKWIQDNITARLRHTP